MNVNWEKIWLYNLICHLSFLKKLSPTHTHPLISICEFLKPYNWLFLEFESFVNGWMWIGKEFHSIILSVTCHSLQKLSPYSYTSPHIHSWIFKTLRVIIFWVWVIHKRLNVNWKIIHCKNFICHLSFLYMKLSPTHTHPLHDPFMNSLETFQLIISWVWVIPSYPFVNFQNPKSYYVSWVLVICKRLNVNWKKIHSIILYVICHFLRNFLSLIHMPHIHS